MKQQQNDSETPEWWDSTDWKRFKEQWVESINDYVEDEDLDKENITLDDQLLKGVIKEIAERDLRWKNFKRSAFNTQRHNLHKSLYDVIRNRVTDIKLEAQKQRQQKEEAEAAAAQQKLNEERAQEMEQQIDST